MELFEELKWRGLVDNVTSEEVEDVINNGEVTFSVSRWHGGKVHFIKESVIHLMRGQIYTIDGKTFFTFGGGYSCDIETRVEHRSWWQQELPTTQEWNEALKRRRTQRRSAV